MDPTTPVLPTVIITHPTPLPPVPRRSIPYDRECSSASTYIASFFPSDSSASSSTTRRGSEKLDHGLLAPYPYSPGSTRRRKSKRHQTAVQIGLLFLAALLLFTSTRWRDEWAGRGMMGLLVPSSSLSEAFGGRILDAWGLESFVGETNEAIAAEITAAGAAAASAEEGGEQAVQTGKMGAMKMEEWKAYLANQQSMTGYAGPAATMEAWDFH